MDSVAAINAARALLSPVAVRQRANEILDLGLAGRLTSFEVDLSALPRAADYVVETIRLNYPTLKIPFHARWRHFCFGGRYLWAAMAQAIPDRLERSRAGFDLAIVSVLLDAGAGMAWRYQDAEVGETSKSEGLALASLRMFGAGAFSASISDPLRADGAALAALRPQAIAAGFQTSVSNPLVGVDGRTALLNALGHTVAALPGQRPGGLFDILLAQAKDGKLGAPSILSAVLEHLGPVWPSRLTLAGVPLGDTWRHPLVGGADGAKGLVPFHKLSQWLSYSLIEPLQWAGVEVTDIDGLTGLPEYRNGGLFVDIGVLRLKHAAMADAANTVDSPLVVEWRALTVALLDRIAPLVRDRLGLEARDFPLARVLEGGTWSAGRRIARTLRADGGPPIRVVSDGTVF